MLPSYRNKIARATCRNGVLMPRWEGSFPHSRVETELLGRADLDLLGRRMMRIQDEVGSSGDQNRWDLEDSRLSLPDPLLPSCHRLGRRRLVAPGCRQVGDAQLKHRHLGGDHYPEHHELDIHGRALKIDERLYCSQSGMVGQVDGGYPFRVPPASLLSRSLPVESGLGVTGFGKTPGDDHDKTPCSMRIRRLSTSRAPASVRISAIGECPPSPTCISCSHFRAASLSSRTCSARAKSRANL